MNKNLAIILIAALALSLMTACTVSVGGQGSANSAAPSGDNGGGSAFIPSDKDEIITFQFEDAEHMQAVVAWLKTVLYAEDYYAFIDGEDYDAPYDFDDESPIWLDDGTEETQEE